MGNDRRETHTRLLVARHDMALPRAFKADKKEQSHLNEKLHTKKLNAEQKIFLGHPSVIKKYFRKPVETMRSTPDAEY